MTKPDFDVVVVGAGPSGTAASYRLATRGVKVLLLDRTAFPRVKACGGGLTIKTLNLMPYSIAPVLERATSRLGMGLRGASGRDRFEVFEAPGHVCAFSVREAFDKFNFDKTLAAGVTFEVCKDLSEVDERASFVSLTIDGKTITASHVIGADGANSNIRKLATKGTWFKRGFALEGLIDYADLGKEPLAEFFFGYVKNGYGWLFPKRDHVNVGIYTFDDDVSLSKDRLRQYALDRVGSDKLHSIVGFPLGFGGRNYAPGGDRVVLVGDAAGFAEPLLGEGIHNAIKSGQIAADAILSVRDGREETLRRAYRTRLAPIFSDVARCDDLCRSFFYPNLEGIGFGALRFPLGKEILMRGFAAGKTMHELTNSALLFPFFSVSTPPSLREFLAAQGGVGSRAPISA